MKTILIIVLLVAVFVIAKRVLAGPSVNPADAHARVKAGAAILIDVREPAEWAGGVAGPAVLASLSDLRGPRTQ